MDDTDKLMLEIIKLAIESPNKVYEKPISDPNVSIPCYYTEDKHGSIPGVNGCIFGIALTKLWPEHTNELIQIDKMGYLANNGICSIWNKLDKSGKGKKSVLFRHIQNTQDYGGNWSKTILDFEKEIRKLYSNSREIMEALDVLSTKK